MSRKFARAISATFPGLGFGGGGVVNSLINSSRIITTAEAVNIQPCLYKCNCSRLCFFVTLKLIENFLRSVSNGTKKCSVSLNFKNMFT